MLSPAHLARVDLNLLVLFSVVREERNVARAAERLNLTASAVSHGLGRLRRLLNDPLFLRMPRGVVPTARALEIAEPVAEILARVGAVIATAAPFDPATTRRRFTIGAPDAVTAVLLSPLLDSLSRSAPGIDVGLRQVLPIHAGRITDQPWQGAFAELDSRALDIAVLPIDAVPRRFVERKLFEEDFVVAMRRGHAFARELSLAQFCRMRHLLVSLTADPRGLVDELLTSKGLSRRVVLTVPSFMLALAQIAESDLIGTLPRRLVARQAARFGLVSAELPLSRRRDPIRAVVTKAAMADAGVAWLLDRLAECAAPGLAATSRSRPPKARRPIGKRPLAS